MKANLLLPDSYKNMEFLDAYAFSISHCNNWQMNSIYLFNYDWMRQTSIEGAISVAEPVLLNVHKSSKKEFEVSEAKTRLIADEYLKMNRVDVLFDSLLSGKKHVDQFFKKTVKDSEELVNEKLSINVFDNYVRKTDLDRLMILRGKEGFFKERIKNFNTSNVLTYLLNPMLVYYEN